jgi:hypothetical protein
MSHDAFLRQVFVSLDVNDDFTEAALHLADGSVLRFRHCVSERWVRATAADSGGAFAERILGDTARFRLNGKHLDIQFADGSRWEARFR